MNNWVTVARYSALADVDMARGRLQAAGIEAWIEGEQSASSNVLGMPYTRLKVPEAQAEEACRVLESLNVEVENEEVDTEADEVPAAQDLAWVKVAQCSSLCEADLICSRLRADGLDARIEDECSMILGTWAVGQMTQPPTVSVPANQAAEAFEILDALENSDELEEDDETDDSR